MPVPDDLSRKVVGLNRKKKNSEELNGNNNPRLDFILDNFQVIEAVLGSGENPGCPEI